MQTDVPDSTICLEDNRFVCFSGQKDSIEKAVTRFNEIAEPKGFGLCVGEQKYTLEVLKRDSSPLTILWQRNKQGITWLFFGLLLVALVQLFCSPFGQQWVDTLKANIGHLPFFGAQE